MPPKDRQQNPEEVRQLPELNGHEGHQSGAIGPQGAMFYSAPIPPSSEFAKYDQILPGAADRILSMSEGQSKHRQKIEKFVIVIDGITKLAGLLSAFFIVVGGMLVGTYLIMNGKNAQGLISLIVPLGTVAVAFIYQRSKDTDDE